MAQVQFRKEIFDGLDAAEADMTARINCDAKVRCLDRLSMARAAALAGDADQYRYFMFAAQGASQVIPPVKSAGIWSPGK